MSHNNNTTTVARRNKRLFIAGVVQLFVFVITIALAGADIGIFRSTMKGKIIRNQIGSVPALYGDELANDPQYYPYPFSTLIVGIAAFLSCLVNFILSFRPDRSLSGIIFANILWTLAWAGMFGWGCYIHSDYSSDGCGVLGATAAAAQLCTYSQARLTTYVFSGLSLVATLSALFHAYRARSARRAEATTQQGMGGMAYQPKPEMV